MPAAMTLAEYVDALTAAVNAAGVKARAWHGRTESRIYRGDDYVEVYEAEDGTGGFSPIKGRDRGFGLALRTANAKLGDVPIVAGSATPIAAEATARTTPADRRRTGCPCGSLCGISSPRDCASCRHDSE